MCHFRPRDNISIACVFSFTFSQPKHFVWIFILDFYVEVETMYPLKVLIVKIVTSGDMAQQRRFL